MKTFFSKFRTLEQIQGSFSQSVQDLQCLRERNAESIQFNQAVIVECEKRVGDLTTENIKAQKFQKNLEALMGE